jgi:hypothetical protein
VGALSFDVHIPLTLVDFAREATRRKAGVPLRSHESEELLARQARLR